MITPREAFLLATKLMGGKDEVRCSCSLDTRGQEAIITVKDLEKLILRKSRQAHKTHGKKTKRKTKL